jgi:hypothetical protein
MAPLSLIGRIEAKLQRRCYPPAYSMRATAVDAMIVDVVDVSRGKGSRAGVP